MISGRTVGGSPPATRSACRASRPQREAEFYRYPPGVGMRPAERAAGILPAEARRIPPRGTFPRPPAVRAVCRRDARQHAVKTAVRGPQRRGVRGHLPLGGSIPSRRDQFTVMTGLGTCLVPSRSDLCSGSWRVAPPATCSISSARATRKIPQETAVSIPRWIRGDRSTFVRCRTGRMPTRGWTAPDPGKRGDR